MLAEQLKNSISIFKKNNFDIFMNNGSLLGMIRNSDFLDHDDDVDCGVIFQGKNLDEALISMIEFEGIFLKQNFNTLATIFHGNNLQFHWKFQTEMPVHVDLFPYLVIQ